jgi:hypothetical protein
MGLVTLILGRMAHRDGIMRCDQAKMNRFALATASRQSSDIPGTVDPRSAQASGQISEPDLNRENFLTGGKKGL